MLKPDKRAILVKILNSQELGDKTKTKILEHFDNDTLFEDAGDPLSTFIFDAVTKGDDADDIKGNINYAVLQMTKAENSIFNQ